MSEQAREGAAYGDMKAVDAGQAADNSGFSQCEVRSQTTVMGRFRAYGHRQLGVLLIVGANVACLRGISMEPGYGPRAAIRTPYVLDGCFRLISDTELERPNDRDSP